MADYTLSAKITGDASGLEKAFSVAQSKLESFSTKIESMGKAFLPISTATAGAGVAVGKMAVDFQDSMANINTLLDDTTNLKGYENAVMNLSNETGMSLDTMSDGMYQAISSLGDGGAETEKIFTTMAKSAKAGGAEVSDSVSLISAGMKGYNSVNGETAQKISDLAFQTAKLGVTTFPEMAKSMQPLFPLSSSLNINYEELFGTMATLTGVTGNTAEVSTQFKAVLSNLMAPTASMGKLIEKYGYANAGAMLQSEGLAGVMEIVKNETGGQVDELAELFSSTEAVTAVTALTGAQFDTFKDKLGQMSTATGATETAYEKLQTSGDKLRIIFNNIKNMATILGGTMMDMLAPAIDKIGDIVSKASEHLINMDEKSKRIIIVIGGIVAATAPALLIIGKIGSVVTGLSGGLAALSAACNPLVILIIALGAGFILLSNNSEQFSQIMNRVKDSVQMFAEQIKAVAIESFGASLESLKNMLSQLRKILEPLANGILSALFWGFEACAAIIKGLIPVVAAVITLFADVMSVILASAIPAAQKIGQAFDNIGFIVSSLIAEYISPLGQKFADVINNIGAKSALLENIGNIFSTVFNAIGNVAEWLVTVISKPFDVYDDCVMISESASQRLYGAIAPIFEKVHTVISTAFNTIAPIIQTAFSTINAVISGLASNIPGILSNAFAQIGTKLSLAFSAIIPVITTVFEGIKTVAGTLFQAFQGFFVGLQSGLSSGGVSISQFGSMLLSVFTGANPIVKILMELFKNFGPQIMDLVAALGANLVPVFSALGLAIGQIVSAVFPALQTAMSALIPAIMKIVSVVMQAVNAILPVVMMLISQFSPLFAQIITMVGQLVASLAPLIASLISSLMPVITEIITVVGNLISGIMPIIISVLQMIMSVIQSIIPIITTLGQVLADVIMAVLPGIQTAVISILPAIQQIVTVIGEIANAVLPMVVSIIQQLVPFLLQIANMISQILSVLAPLISQLIGALLPVIQNVIAVVMNIVTAAMPAVIAIMNVVMSVIQALIPIITNIISVVVNVVSNIIAVISPIVSFIGGVITAIISVITPIISFVANIMATIIQAIGTIINVVTSIFATVYNIISGVFQNACNFVSNIIDTIGNIIATISNVVSTVFNEAYSLVSSIFEKIRTLIANVINAIGNTINTIRDTFNNVFNKIYNIVSSIMNKVKRFIANIFDGIKNSWSGLTDFVGGIFDGIMAGVSGLISKIKGVINFVIGGINGAIDIINLIPGVEISPIAQLYHGTDDFQGGFARMNEGGRGELTYLPNGTQVIPHDISVQYAKEAARSSDKKRTENNTSFSNTEINLYGNYEFKDRSDMDYFMNQLGLKVASAR